MGLREVHFLSIFALIYVGVEVTLGGQTHFEMLSRLATDVRYARLCGVQAGLLPTSSNCEAEARLLDISRQGSLVVGLFS